MELKTAVFLVLVSLSLTCAQKTFEFEAEDVSAGNDTLNVVNRETASNRQALWMLASQTAMLKFQFCLAEEADVRVDNILFSNDGEEDIFTVLMDWEEIGTFRTHSRSENGKAWNDYIPTGRIGHTRRLAPGQHSLVLHLTQSDKFGVEIDKIIVTVSDENIQKQVFLCNVFCFEDITYKHVKGRDYVPSARLELRSESTPCAEIDNIKVPFYHNSAKSYEIRAMHPKYKAFSNIRDPDWTDCEMAIERLWRFDNITYQTNKEEMERGKSAVLTFSQEVNSYAIVVFFALRGPRRGSPDSEIGSILTVLLNDSIVEPVELGFSYLGRQGEYTNPIYYVFKPNALNFTLEIPDFTWADGPSNAVKISVPKNFTNTLEFKTINLRKRPQKEEKSFDYHDNGDFVIQGVDVDFWWQYNKNMTVKIGDKMYYNADYVRFYQKIPWTNDKYGQTMVIYQDGMVRLLPITPPGVDWIPFGSSILLGESNPTRPRPSANIKLIDIDVKKMSMKIVYENGNMATVHLRSSFTETILTVSDVTYKNRSKFPFLTFMSMWVADGNSDVDHVSVNGNMAHRINDWQKLFGTSVVFYRKCLSKHNTLSPDIRVDLLK